MNKVAVIFWSGTGNTEAMAAAVVLWTRYVVAYLEQDNVFGKLLYTIGRLFFVVEVIAVAVNCFYPLARLKKSAVRFLCAHSAQLSVVMLFN